MRTGWDVKCWNLAAAVGDTGAAFGAMLGVVVAGGCSDASGVDTEETTASSGLETDGPDGDTEGEPDPPNEPECETREDCGGSFYSCEAGRCVDNWDDCNYYDCGDTDEYEDTDDPAPECLEDTDCSVDAWCDTRGEEPSCEPVVIPSLCGDELSLAFTPLSVAPVAEATSFELVGPPGAEMMLIAGQDEQGQTSMAAVALDSGAVTPLSFAQPQLALSGGDLDGDGDVDVVATRAGTVTVLEQQEPGVFQEASQFEWGGHFTWLAVAGNDGPDASIVGLRSNRLWRVDPVGALDYGKPEPISPVESAGAGIAVVGEFDGVGREDVAWVEMRSFPQEHHFRLDGTERAPFRTYLGSTMQVGDGQGDGVEDLLVFAAVPEAEGVTRVDVALPEPLLDGSGRVLLTHGKAPRLDETAADVDGDGASDAVLLVTGADASSSELVFGRQLLGEACASVLPLDGVYGRVQAIQHPDGTGWIVLDGPEGFRVAPL